MRKELTKLGFKVAEGTIPKDNTYDLCLPEGGFITVMLSKDKKSIKILVSDWENNKTREVEIKNGN